VLATIFVTLVIFAHSVAPQANLPRVLGVNVSGDQEESQTSTGSGDTSGRSKEELRNRMLALGELRRDRYLEMLQTRNEATEEARLVRERTRERVQATREQFKEDLQELKDQKKAKVVANIDEIIVNRNERWVTHWNRVLTRLALILAKIEARRDNLAFEGKDASALTVTISQARSAIDAAQASVDAQAAKTYIIDIESEINLGQSVRSVVHQFKQDISAVVVKVKAARQAVQDAFKALKAVTGEEGSEAEASPTPTPVVTDIPAI